jgi:hypothetical protein
MHWRMLLILNVTCCVILFLGAVTAQGPHCEAILERSEISCHPPSIVTSCVPLSLRHRTWSSATSHSPPSSRSIHLPKIPKNINVLVITHSTLTARYSECGTRRSPGHGHGGAVHVLSEGAVPLIVLSRVKEAALDLRRG